MQFVCLVDLGFNYFIMVSHLIRGTKLSFFHYKNFVLEYCEIIRKLVASLDYTNNSNDHPYSVFSRHVNYHDGCHQSPFPRTD